MEILAVDPIWVDRHLLVRIRTDADIVGVGESGAWGFLEASFGALTKFGEYLVGKDPMLIEHHWQYMYRYAHFRGSAIMGALSAIDIALWDIKGKAHGVPISSLLGGPVRAKARVFAHVFGRDPDAIARGIEAARAEGFTAAGHLSPFGDVPRSQVSFETTRRRLESAVEAVSLYREAAGDDMDLCIEVHRRLSPAEAVQFIDGIAHLHPLFVEDPVTPDNFDETAWVSGRVNVPIATGERLTSLWEYAMLFRRDAAQFIRPDVCMVGGISGAKKICALAEAQHIQVVPHNPLSPISTAACLQIAMSVPNFALMDFPPTADSMADERPPPAAIVDGVPQLDTDGFVRLPTAPGLGISLREEAELEFPYRFRPIETRIHADGSVVDQ